MIDIVIGAADTLSTDLLDTELAGRGYRVHCAAPGHLAAAVAAHRPRLVLTEGATEGAGQRVDTALTTMLAALPGLGGPAVIVMSGDDRRPTVEAALRAGARGYVHHGAGLAALLDAVARVERGEVVVAVPTRHHGRHAAPVDAARIAATLTTRELECLAMLVEGVSTQQITTRLGISTLTVRSHVQSILSKLGVHSRLEAASLAVRHGLLDDHAAAG